MGTTVSISLHVEQRRLADAFEALLQRMLRQGTVSKALLRRKYWHRPTVAVSEERLRTQTRSLANAVPDSDEALEIELGYPLASGRRIALDLMLYGAGYEDGSQVEIGGHIQLRLSHNELAGPLRSLLAQEDGDPDLGELAQTGAEVLGDAEQLFLAACGLPGDPPGAGFEHAAMYLEAGWPAPAGCSMVFHRKAEDFVKDFARIYAEYRLDLHMPAMLSPDFDEKKLEQPKEPLGKNVEFYRQFSRPDGGDILEFLEGLDRRELRRLSVLPAERMRSLLKAASENVTGIECYDFADHGLVLAANPVSSVWRAYQFVQKETA